MWTVQMIPPGAFWQLMGRWFTVLENVDYASARARFKELDDGQTAVRMFQHSFGSASK